MQSSKPWRVRPTDVREFNGSLRWSLHAQNGDEVTTITADSTEAGSVFALQSETHIDSSLGDEVRWVVSEAIGQHEVLRQLNSITGRRYGRSDRLRVAA
jgi:hypothetical protein